MARLTTEQFFDNVSVAPKTLSGNLAPIDGEVEMASSDEAVVIVEKRGPNLFRVSSGVKGASQVSAVFDADMGEGVRTIEATGVIEVVDAEAVTAEIIFGDPVQKDTVITGQLGNVQPE